MSDIRSDTIKRSDAIEQLNEAISICPPCMKGTGIYRTSALEEAIDIINQIPSADRPQLDKDVVEPIGNGNVIMSEDTYEELLVDRPQGEWIDAEIPLECGGSMPIQVCNLCKTFYPLAYTGGGHRFCPNCGARMKGEDDGNK